MYFQVLKATFRRCCSHLESYKVFWKIKANPTEKESTFTLVQLKQLNILMKIVFTLYLSTKSLKKFSYLRAMSTFSTLAEFPFSLKAVMICHIETFISKGVRESAPHNAIWATAILQLQYQFMAKHNNSSVQFFLCADYWRYTYRSLQLCRTNHTLETC